MAYVGTPIDTRNQFQSLQGKRFNGDGSTTDFTLDVAPSSTLDIEVFVGNVRQDPNSAYTLSGTTLSFTGAPPSGTNNIYVVHQAKSVGTIHPPATETVAKTFSGAVNVTGAFNSVGIDDNGDATTMTIDTSENVNIGDATNRGFGPVQMGNASNAQAYLQMLSSTAGNIHFGDATSGDARFIGSIVYRHDTNLMKFQTNGATGLQIDSAGHVTMPLQSFVYASLSADQTITANDSDAKVTLDQELYDVNGDFNTSTNTFTAPVSGVYMVTAAWQFVEDLNANITDVAMKLNASNGDEFVKFENPQALQVSTGSEFKYYANGSKIIYMDANDTMYLEIDAYSNSSSITFKLNGGTNQRAETSMQIYLLG